MVLVGDDAGEPTVAGLEDEGPLVARKYSTKLEVSGDGIDSEPERLVVDDGFG